MSWAMMMMPSFIVILVAFFIHTVAEERKVVFANDLCSSMADCDACISTAGCAWCMDPTIDDQTRCASTLW